MQTNTGALMTVGEAAQFLSVSVSTLYGWAWQRRIPFVKMGRALRFERADLEKFVEANRHAARNEILGQGSPLSRRMRGAAGKG